MVKSSEPYDEKLKEQVINHLLQNVSVWGLK